MWKHSLVKEEHSPSRFVDETMCGIESPKQVDMSIADECMSMSPLPRIQSFTVATFKQNNDKHKAQNTIDFHENYLKLGLWPEMSFEK